MLCNFLIPIYKDYLLSTRKQKVLSIKSFVCVEEIYSTVKFNGQKIGPIQFLDLGGQKAQKNTYFVL